MSWNGTISFHTHRVKDLSPSEAMTIFKRPLDSSRIRRIPEQGFSWLDRRFIRDGWLCALEREAAYLYFFLVAVSDAEGLSFYADSTICRLLGFDQEALVGARARLLASRLVLYSHPLYQVLPLPTAPPEESKPKQSPERRHRNELTSLSDILREALRQAAHPCPPEHPAKTIK